MNFFQDIRFWLLFIGLFGVALLIQHILFIMTKKKDEKSANERSEAGIN